MEHLAQVSDHERRILVLERQVKELTKIVAPMLESVPIVNPQAKETLTRSRHSCKPRHVLTTIQQMAIVNDYQNDIPGETIIKQYNTSWGTIYGVLHAHGILLKRRHGQVNSPIKVRG